MRMIGQFNDETSARSFSDFLYVRGVGHELEREPGGAWELWVKSDDDCAQATDWMRIFGRNPLDPLFSGTAQQAAKARLAEQEDLARYRQRVKGPQKLFVNIGSYRFGPLTFALVFVSVVLFIFMQIGSGRDAIRLLLFSEYEHSGGWWQRIADLPELRTGQVWRLFTPIFIHFGIMHVLFNMMWLVDLGSMVEGRQGTALLARLVAGIALGSNVVQYAATGYPNFGGMSGVVYGLLGYIWLRGKFDPGCGLYLNRQTVTMSLIWFVLCFTGVLGNVANGAHAGGLIIGSVWGWLASLRRR